MTNIISTNSFDLKPIFQSPQTTLHMYGKKIARPNRKMGHMTTISSVLSRDQLLTQARKLKENIIQE